MTYEKFVHAWYSVVGKVLVIVCAIWILIAVGLLGSAIVDVLFNIGWGYSLQDVLSDLLVTAAGCFAMAAVWAVYRCVGRLQHMIFGRSRDGAGFGPP